ncbi:SDR family oxidoreductase [Novipirellula sp. SH528]|uniref:SDR family oxidoreductase n=1 Tax=Novipirellula sp. SH528 TaxID=3454466 RepID=UPI003F9F64E1
MNKSKTRGNASSKKQRPKQSQHKQPGIQSKMKPQPRTIREDYVGSGKLESKVALITGGDSGIGRSVAVMFAREGADIAFVYLNEKEDAEQTRSLVEAEGRVCLTIKADIGKAASCKSAVAKTVKKFGRLDVLVNNAAEQHPQDDIDAITEKQLIATFSTNVFPMFYLTQAALPHLKEHAGSSIINTTSVTAYRGSPGLLDYAATKGAIVAYTRSLSQKLVDDGIRVNAVAPGPIWTPLIPATFDKEKVSKFGSDTPMGRAGQPDECGSCYVFLASEDASYITGQVLHPNGGEVING